ncbi:MAG TPA: efflux transporter outer membrane subunit [Puia sp.]|jgi:NodT family efflux transporter outer membrane factor (OMF) lipoprotein
MRKLVLFEWLLLVALITAGISCRTGKNYQRPEVPLPDRFGQQSSYSDTSSIADIDWKTFFADTALQQLIDSGISRNYDLQLALKRIGIAQEQMKQARLLWYPQVDLQISGQVNRPSDNSLNGISANSFLGKSYIEDYNASLNMTWEIDIWGKISRQKESTLAQYLQSYEGAKAVQTRLVADIAQGYFNLLMLDQQLAVSRQNLELNENFEKITRLLFDAGEVTYLAVQQAVSQKQSTALLVPQLEQSIAIQENALQLLTGSLPGAIARQERLSDMHFRDSLSAGLPVAMLSRRPDVRSSEMALVYANAQVGIAQADMYPAINLTAGVGLESFKASNWFNIPNSLFGLATGTILQPLFRRRELKTRFETAKLEREEAVIQFRQSVLTATTEVSNAQVQIDKLKEQEGIARAQTDTLKSAVSNAEYLFKSDMANYLEVITAQQNALQSQLNLASIQRQKLDAMVELYRALGGGWK